MSQSDVLILGAGGHARVVADALRTRGTRIVAFAEVDPALCGSMLVDIPVMSERDALSRLAKDSVRLANGVGSVGSVAHRRALHMRLAAAGWQFTEVLHASAIVSSQARLESGAQVMAGAVVQVGATIGVGSIVNSGAVVEHDCIVAAHCHIAPGAVLSGGVELGEGSHIGTGAVIIQGVKLGAGTVIGAGAVVIRDHPGGALLVGVPATPRGTT